MSKLKVELKHENAKTPFRATEGSFGYDVHAVSVSKQDGYVEYDTGVAVRPPEGFGVLFLPRSSVSSKTDLILANSAGLIDADYSGSVKARFKVVKESSLSNPKLYEVGDKIGQLVVIPMFTGHVQLVEKLETTVRGEGSFGSTDLPQGNNVKKVEN